MFNFSFNWSTRSENFHLFQETLKNSEEEETLNQTQQFLRTFQQESETSPESGLGTKSEYKARLARLRITPERVARVVPDRIFSIAVHPSIHKVDTVALEGKILV